MHADTPPEPLRIAEINETRQMHALRDLAEQSLDVAGGTVCFSPGIDWINHAVGVGLNTDVADTDLDAIETFLRDRGVTPKIEFTTFATEPFLASLASRHYYTEHFENVLVRPLHAGEDPFATLTRPRTPGLEIIRTDPADEVALREHARLVMSGFMPEPIPEEHIRMCIDSIVHPRSTGFTAILDGTPVAACGMEIFEHQGQRIASLWGAAVAEPARRRGIQQAMLAHRIAHALDHDCIAALIESKPGIATERNAARMGFALGYVRVCMAKRQPDATPPQ